MKRFMKICLITGGVCLLIGGGITTVAYAMGGRLSDSIVNSHNYGWPDSLGRKIKNEIQDEIDHVYSNETPAGEGKSYSQEYARKLDLDVRWGSVEILEDSNAELITVYCDADESYWYTVSEGDELKVKAAPESWDSRDYSDTVVTITVPAGYRFESVDLKVRSMTNNNPKRVNRGPAVCADGLRADKMEIDAKAGSVKLIAAEAGELEVNADVGKIDIKGSVTGKVDAECNVGNISLELAGKKEDYNYEINCHVGSVSVDGESFSGLSSEKKIDNSAGKKMELECNTGAISVDFLNTL